MTSRRLFVGCALLVAGTLWCGQPSKAETQTTNSVVHRLTKQTLRNKGAFGLGVLQQSYSFSSPALGAFGIGSVIAVGTAHLVVLVGNIVLATSPEGSMGWGITGCVFGGIAGMAGLSLLPFLYPMWYIYLPILALSAALLGFGIQNILNARKARRPRMAMTPYINPTKDARGWEGGLQVSGHF